MKNPFSLMLRAAFPDKSPLTELGLTKMRADYESSAPTGISMSDIQGMEQFLIGIRTHTGQIVTPEKAKRCAAVLAIMRGLSEDISCLPLHLFKHTPHGAERYTDHVVDPLLNQEPNEIMTALEMREHMMWDLMLWGNFFNLKNEDPNNPGELFSLWPLQAAYVTRRWREMVWVFTDPVTGISGEFTPDIVWRGTILAADGIDGTAITLLCREAIGILLAAEEQGARLFKNGVQTDLALETTETIGAPEKEQLRQAFMNRHAGSSNAWMPLLLEGGLKAQKIGLTAQESQYIESRGFQIADIARAFRYPEVLLGSTGKSSRSATYASAEQFFQSYTKHTLNPWAVRIEQTAHRDLLDVWEKRKYFFRHNFEELNRGDTAARYASYATGIASGFMSPADARKKENLVYVPGLDYYTRPLNTAATAGGDAAAVKPTDVSGKGIILPPSTSAFLVSSKETFTPGADPLARIVANFVLDKERKALIGQKEDADAFYARSSAFIGELTGASSDEARAYLDMRRADIDRFSTESQDRAIAALIELCRKDN